MKKATLLLVIALLGISINYTYAQDSKYKAQYLINLTSYASWSGEITIGVFGESPVFSELTAVAQDNSRIKVVKIEEEESIKNCDMVFIPQPQSYNFNRIQEVIGESGIVVVVENDELISEGAEMAFYKEDDKLKFAVNQTAIDNAGVKISPKFLANVRVMQ